MGCAICLGKPSGKPWANLLSGATAMQEDTLAESAEWGQTETQTTMRKAT